MIQIQKELLEHGIDQVVEKYGLLYKDYGHKFLLKYSQINSIDYKAVMAVRESRGIILDKKFNIMALPFVRFFNYGEAEADQLDHNNFYVFKKEDGSLINVYYDYMLDKFCVQTSGTAEAESQVGILNISFKELFLKTIDLDFSKLNKNYNYVFELCCLENKVVEHHDKNFVSLLTIRDMGKIDDGKYGELTRDQIKIEADRLSLDVVDSYSFNSIDDVLHQVDKLEKTREGYVIMDENFKRIKVKNPKYVMLHQMKSSFSLENIIKVIIDNEIDEFLAYFPEYKEIIKDHAIKYNQLKEELKSLIDYIEKEHGFSNEKRKDVAIFLNSEKKHLSLFHNIIYKNFTEKVNVDNELHNIHKLKKFFK